MQKVSLIALRVLWSFIMMIMIHIHQMRHMMFRHGLNPTYLVLSLMSGQTHHGLIVCMIGTILMVQGVFTKSVFDSVHLGAHLHLVIFQRNHGQRILM